MQETADARETRELIREALRDRVFNPEKPVKTKRGRPRRTNKETESRILDLLAGGPCHKRGLLKRLHSERGEASRLLAILMNRGIILQTGKGSKHSPAVLSLAVPVSLAGPV